MKTKSKKERKRELVGYWVSKRKEILRLKNKEENKVIQAMMVHSKAMI